MSVTNEEDRDTAMARAATDEHDYSDRGAHCTCLDEALRASRAREAELKAEADRLADMYLASRTEATGLYAKAARYREALKEALPFLPEANASCHGDGCPASFCEDMHDESCAVETCPDCNCSIHVANIVRAALTDGDAPGGTP